MRPFAWTIVFLLLAQAVFSASYNTVLVHMLPAKGNPAQKSIHQDTLTALINNELEKTGSYEIARNFVLTDSAEWKAVTNDIGYSVTDATQIGRFSGIPLVMLVNVRYSGQGCFLQMGLFDTDFQILIGETAYNFPDASARSVKSRLPKLIYQAIGKSDSADLPPAVAMDTGQSTISKTENIEHHNDINSSQPSSAQISSALHRTKWILLGVSATLAVVAGVQLYNQSQQTGETVKRTEMEVNW
ncbi:MAG: hypothetical protein JNL74_10590 [Fibrobacteres bacterium]|nr:hypothetical protein [Fibrobacterota bacterium]